MAEERARGMPRRDGAPGERQLRARSRDASGSAALSLVHSAPVFYAGEILRGGKFEVRRCPVFGKDLLYFFVLRPAYRSRLGGEKSHQLTRFPVAFIVRPEAVEPYSVYPMDTGAAAGGAFAGQADPFVFLEDYELEPNHAAAAGHIAWAFGSLAAYYDGVLRADILDDVPQHEVVTRGFADVARMGREGSNRHDRRASTVEVTSSRDVQLQGNVLLAIVPKQFLEDPAGPNGAMIARLKELAIPFRTYEWQPNTAPDEFQKDISDIARGFYREEGLC